MVLGIGETSLELFVEKNTFRQGETVNGRVRLQMKQSAAARELRVEFYGSRNAPGLRVSPGKEKHYQCLKLSGEKTYRSGETYQFSIKLPRDIYPPSYGDGIYGWIQYLLTKELYFQIRATLVFPGKLNAIKIKEIYIPKPPKA